MERTARQDADSVPTLRPGTHLPFWGGLTSPQVLLLAGVHANRSMHVLRWNINLIEALLLWNARPEPNLAGLTPAADRELNVDLCK